MECQSQMWIEQDDWLSYCRCNDLYGRRQVGIVGNDYCGVIEIQKSISQQVTRQIDIRSLFLGDDDPCGFQRQLVSVARRPCEISPFGMDIELSAMDRDSR